MSGCIALEEVVKCQRANFEVLHVEKEQFEVKVSAEASEGGKHRTNPRLDRLKINLSIDLVAAHVVSYGYLVSKRGRRSARISIKLVGRRKRTHHRSIPTGFLEITS